MLTSIKKFFDNIEEISDSFKGKVSARYSAVTRVEAMNAIYEGMISAEISGEPVSIVIKGERFTIIMNPLDNSVTHIKSQRSRWYSVKTRCRKERNDRVVEKCLESVFIMEKPLIHNKF